MNEHAVQVATAAAFFAAVFNSKSVAFIMGFLRDFGKARSTFQSYLRGFYGIKEDDLNSGEHSHFGIGACFAYNHLGSLERAIAY